MLSTEVTDADLVGLGADIGPGADGKSNPEALLSRAQMVTVVVRTLDSAYPGLLPPAPNGDWASVGFDDPEYGDYLTRAEAAQILWNAAGAYLEP